MEKLNEACTEHLYEALSSENPSKKDYHIRQVLQICGVSDLPDELEIASIPSEKYD